MKIIKNLEIKLILKMLSIVFCTNSFAEINHLPLVPLPSVIDYTHGNGWSGGVGFKAESAAVFHGSNHYEIYIKPEGAVQWRNGDNIFFWEGFDLNYAELGWRGLVKEKWLLEAGARHEIVIPSSRSEKAGIDQLPHRGSHILGFFETKYSIGNGWRNWVSGRFMGGSNKYGWQAKVEAGHSFSRGLDNNKVEVILFSTFGNKDNLNNYFGVSEFDSTVSGLQSINLEGGYRSSGLNIIYRESMSKNIQITAKAGIELYNSEIEKSDLVGDASETSAEVSVVWTF
jgi:outer membrane protein